MFRSSVGRWLLGLILLIAVLAFIRFKPWRLRGNSQQQAQARAELKVGFLPVTCHLTCPVTDYATRTSTMTHFESQRFTDFPTVVESIKSGRLDATFMIAPLAMKSRDSRYQASTATSTWLSGN